MCSIVQEFYKFITVHYSEEGLEYSEREKTLLRNGRPLGFKEGIDFRYPNVSCGLRVALVALISLALIASLAAAIMVGCHYYGGYHTFDHIATWMKGPSNFGFSNGKLLAIGAGMIGCATGLALLFLANKDRHYRKEAMLRIRAGQEKKDDNEESPNVIAADDDTSCERVRTFAGNMVTKSPKLPSGIKRGMVVHESDSWGKPKNSMRLNRDSDSFLPKNSRKKN